LSVSMPANSDSPHSEIIVDPGLTSLLASDLVKRARDNEPIV
jgi:hypothetical protein